MPTIDVSELLRPSLLDGVSVMVAGAHATADPHASPEAGFGAAVEAACAALGAQVSVCELDMGSGAAGESATEQAVDGALARAGAVELLAIDCASLFAAGADEPRGGRERLGECLDASWNVTRAVVNRAFLAGERGRIVYIAPAPDSGEHADAARAGLENLARTLSIEWARHSVTAVAIAPGASAGTAPGQTAGDVAALIAYLASPAGAYFSGCLLDLRGPAA